MTKRECEQIVRRKWGPQAYVHYANRAQPCWGYFGPKDAPHYGQCAWAVGPMQSVTVIVEGTRPQLYAAVAAAVEANK